jgi:hypothetical protein
MQHILVVKICSLGVKHQSLTLNVGKNGKKDETLDACHTLQTTSRTDHP